ncbi:MAG: tubulin-tyrosine ligase family-domain-containing protein [Monoraphidium minutum]|nr:MAG: tubulin-tyrosine ligase family-domain-containing protein [Monoraphidium minutum]
MDADDSPPATARRPRGGAAAYTPAVRLALHDCAYPVLRLAAARLGWRAVEAEGEGDYFDVYWTDTSVSMERLLRLRPTQVINHFFGMLQLCRKRAMALRLAALQRLEPDAYAFAPRTWAVPGGEAALLADAAAAGRPQAYIIKPDAGCQGIRLAQGGAGGARSRAAPGCAAVAQCYLSRPLLVAGLKFDLRVYALVSSVDPLRVFVYREGLARFCTTPYAPPSRHNLADMTRHLTNFAVNKHAAAFTAPGAAAASAGCAEGSMAHKWSFAQLRAHLEGRGASWVPLWAGVEALVAKSLIAVGPLLRDAYRAAFPAAPPGGCGTVAGGGGEGGAAPRCFELLGFDVLLDEGLAPWLVEVNHSPSFGIDSALDRRGGAVFVGAERGRRAGGVDAVCVQGAATACRASSWQPLWFLGDVGGFVKPTAGPRLPYPTNNTTLRHALPHSLHSIQGPQAGAHHRFDAARRAERRVARTRLMGGGGGKSSGGSGGAAGGGAAVSRNEAAAAAQDAADKR